MKRKTTIVASEVVETAPDAVVTEEAPEPAGAEDSTMVTAEDADEKREDGEEEEGEEPEYTIEKILKQRVRKGIQQFLVKWQGWDEDGDDTWEPLEHVEDTVQYEEWLNSQPKPKSDDKPKPKRSPKKKKEEEEEEEEEEDDEPEADEDDAPAGEGAPTGTPKKRKAPQRKEATADGEAEPASEAKSPKKLKKKKDPTLPKGALSAYNFFAQEERAAVKEANPNFTLGEIGRELGERWRNTPPEARAPFLASQAVDKERYDKELAAHTAVAAAAAAALAAQGAGKVEEPADVEATEVRTAAAGSAGVVAVEVRAEAPVPAAATSEAPGAVTVVAGIPA